CLGNLATQYSWGFVRLSIDILFAYQLAGVAHGSNLSDNKVKFESATLDQEKGDGVSATRKAEFGSANILIELENQRAIK
ncbi:hypothetical protein Droror1_Dr00026838, partial [Drosera rotundifolia]